MRLIEMSWRRKFIEFIKSFNQAREDETSKETEDSAWMFESFRFSHSTKHFLRERTFRFGEVKKNQRWKYPQKGENLRNLDKSEIPAKHSKNQQGKKKALKRGWTLLLN